MSGLWDYRKAGKGRRRVPDRGGDGIKTFRILDILLVEKKHLFGCNFY